ncbi:hypothetical protein BGZ76_011519 [Entomortierella beljakovae]|nr:hypothetical protein BGZ76_011519 [Entomortierella beljakovae]
MATELDYPVHEKEQLTIVYYLDTKKKISGHQIHWQIDVSEFNYMTQYKKGALNVIPDALSHCPDHKNEFGLYTLAFATVSESLAMLSPEVLQCFRTETSENPLPARSTKAFMMKI